LAGAADFLRERPAVLEYHTGVVPRPLALLALALTVAGCCIRPGKPRKDPAPTPSASTSSTGARTHKKPPTAKKKKTTKKRKALAHPDPFGPEAPPKDDCGTVLVDGVLMQLDCLDDGPSAEHREGVDVVQRGALDPDPALVGGLALPETVDHREEGTEGPVRNQGKVGSCTANSLGTAIDHALMRREGRPYEVSALHLWSRYHTPSTPRAVDSNVGHTIAAEDELHYNQKLACAWLSSPKCKACTIDGEAQPCKQPIDTGVVEAADHKPYARLLQVARIDSPSPLVLKQTLARGQDLIVGDYDPAQCTGGHAIVISGYHTQPDGTYFLLHNSWGEKWGDGGYAWIHEKTLRNMKYARVVDATPPGELPPGAREAVPAPAACPPDELPDTATGACASPCPDHGPRFNDACGATEECSPGEINLAGRCVVAAPHRSGTALDTGVGFVCTAGGCVYSIPKGQAGCQHDLCQFSCAAPAYLLSRSGAGLFCTE
jgi:hypothetical protein